MHAANLRHAHPLVERGITFGKLVLNGFGLRPTVELKLGCENINMRLSRRQFCALVAGGVAAGASSSIPHGLAGESASGSMIKAIAFDAFVVFDPRPLVCLAEQLFPGKGEDLSDQWRTRQFEYTWLRVTAKRYVDFWQVTEEALEFAAEKVKLELTREKRDRLMNAFLELNAWPEVMPALQSLMKSGFRLTLLSNLSPAMLAANVAHAGLTGT